MSVRVMQSVWEHSTQKGGALLLMLAIADYARDDGGGAFPSIDTLAAKARMTGRNVNLLLKEIEAAGEIAIDRAAGPRGCNVYRVMLPIAAPEKPSPLKTLHPERSSAEGVKDLPGGVKKTAGGVKPTSPDPSLDPSFNHQVIRQEPSTFRDLLNSVCFQCGGIEPRRLGKRERAGLDAAVRKIIEAGGTLESVAGHTKRYRDRNGRGPTPGELALLHREAG